MNKKNFIIHIGLYKTGSTYLQKNFFENINDKNYFISTKWKNEKIVQNLIDLIKKKIDLETFNKELDKIHESNIIISYEGLFGSFFDGFKDKNERFDLMEKIFNKPKYIIGYRSQPDLLFSFYKERVKHGLINSFKNFISGDDDFLSNQTINVKSITNYKILDYNKILYNYINIKERVLFLDYNNLVSNHKDYINKVSIFTKVSTNYEKNDIKNKSIKNIEYLAYFNEFLIFKFVKLFFIYLIKIKKTFKYSKYSKNYFEKRYLEDDLIILLLMISTYFAVTLKVKSFYDYKRQMKQTLDLIEKHYKTYDFNF